MLPPRIAHTSMDGSSRGAASQILSGALADGQSCLHPDVFTPLLALVSGINNTAIQNAMTCQRPFFLQLVHCALGASFSFFS